MRNAHIIMQTDIQPTLSSKRINVVKINTVCNLKGPERVGMRQTCDDNFRPAWDQVLYEDMKVQYSTTEIISADTKVSELNMYLSKYKNSYFRIGIIVF